MQKDIHPPYKTITAVCSCGATFETRSTLNEETMKLDICSECHPFYTGQSRVMDQEGRVEQFNKRYKGFKRK